MKSFRHLHFTQSLETLQGGGLGTSTVALHRELMRVGVPSTLCSTCAGGPRFGVSSVFEFRRLKPECLYLAPELRRRAKEYVASVDVLHGHGLYVGTNFIFGREARRQLKPLVYHVHGFFEPWILNRSRWKKRLAHLLFEDRNFEHVCFWRALTVREADQIRNLGIKAPIAVVPNGIDVDQFSENPVEPSAPIATPRIPALAKSKPRVLFMSRVHPKKGLDLLIPVWQQLERITKEWELIIAGPEEGGYLEQMIKLSESALSGGPIYFTGPVSGSARVALLRSADLFILPSYSEGFSMAILESMACERPVLATRNCNFPQISEFEAGWECEASRESLGVALTRALQAGQQERAERGARGRNLVKNQYNWHVVVGKLLEACDAYC